MQIAAKVFLNEIKEKISYGLSANLKLKLIKINQIKIVLSLKIMELLLNFWNILRSLPLSKYRIF